ncbi:MAG: hypothetical protein HY751_11540 [Nitrospinae bacterium]|nr:hypothetical protein [Nitrospinota bacterium]
MADEVTVADPTQDASAPKISKGAVAFLDILGFKGMWQSTHPANLTAQINLISNMVAKVQKNVIKEMSTKLDIEANPDQLNFNLLSDTFIITVENEDLSLALFFVVQATQDLILHFALFDDVKPPNLPPARPLFLRGAISTGWFYRKNNMYIGEAIDDAAEWFNQPDFVGAILTPRTGYFYRKLLNDPPKNPNRLLIKYTTPTKKGKFDLYCVDWINRYIALYPHKKFDLKDLYSKFIQNGNISPGVVSKYQNTDEFNKYCLERKT